MTIEATRPALIDDLVGDSDSVAMDREARISEDVIERLAEAGVFKMRLPSSAGGLECGVGEFKEQVAGLAAVSGSTAWVAAVYGIPLWMVGRLSDSAQLDVFGTPDVRVCGTLSPGGELKPREGGFTLTGQWTFITGAHHAQWMQFIAIQIIGGEPVPSVGVVPMSDVEVIDDWDTTGMRATGSVSIAAREVEVPSDRVVPIPAVLEGVPDHPVQMYRAPLLPVAAATSVGAILGIARNAKAVWQKQIPDRGITYSAYDKQDEAPVTHLQAARAAMLLEEAEQHAQALCQRVDRKNADGSTWTLAERIRCRAELGRAAELAQAAVEIYASSGGGRSLYVAKSAIQRYLNDINAVRLHALIHPETNAELYGRQLCGQAPNTIYV